VRPDATLRSVFFTNYLNSEVKLLLVDDFRRINDVPVPYRFEMASQQAPTRTVLNVLDFRHDENLSEDLFTIAHIIGEWR
jgi:hypothetical protein